MNFRSLMKHESAGGVLLMIAAALALAVANSPLAAFYDALLHMKLHRPVGFNISVLHAINDGLMVLFFYLVGLEIKKELLAGHLAHKGQELLPALAALGGMIAPAFVFWLINKDVQANMPGWAIASATDIAFALGVLALLGPRVPPALKALLLAIAIIDDLGAIVIIALFYSHGLVLPPLVLAAAALCGLFALNRRSVTRAAPYIVLGVVLWLALLQSGLHATLAGVATALFIPLRGPHASPLDTQIRALHPFVTFGILPVFAFANAGVPFTGMGLHSLGEPLTLGIILGLFLGKQIGIFGTVFACVKSGLSPMPQGVSWRQVYGMAILCGIGFTMSLFIGTLAFTGMDQQAAIRLGVLTGSLASAVVGYAALRAAGRSPLLSS